MVVARTIPNDVRREVDKEESAEFYLIFLEFRHPQLKDNIRVVSDPENYILDGKEYQGFEFDIKLLSDGDGMPSASLSVQNVDRVIGQAVLASNDPIRMSIQLIAGSQFNNTVFPRTELSVPSARIHRADQLYLTEVEGDIYRITGTIRSWDYTQETFPAIRATQDRFPGLFW